MASPARSALTASTLRSPQMASTAADELAQMPELTRLYSEEELRILGEIVKHANTQAGASDSPMRGRRGAAPSLIEVLKAYDVVLRREGIDADSDTFYYRTVLRMSLDPSQDWWTKLENERRENEQEFAAQVVAASRASPGGMSIRSVASEGRRGAPRSVSADPWSRPGSGRPATSRARPSGRGGVLGDSLERWMDHTGVAAQRAGSEGRATALADRRDTGSTGFTGPHDSSPEKGVGRRTERRMSGVGSVARTLADPPPPPPPASSSASGARGAMPGAPLPAASFDPETPARRGVGLGASFASRGEALGRDALGDAGDGRAGAGGFPGRGNGEQRARGVDRYGARPGLGHERRYRDDDEGPTARSGTASSRAVSPAQSSAAAAAPGPYEGGSAHSHGVGFGALGTEYSSGVDGQAVAPGSGRAAGDGARGQGTHTRVGDVAAVDETGDGDLGVVRYRGPSGDGEEGAEDGGRWQDPSSFLEFRQMAVAFRAWVKWLVHRRLSKDGDYQTEMQLRQQLLVASVRHESRLLEATFLAWKSEHVASKALRERLVGITGMWRHRRRRDAFYAWKEYTEDSRAVPVRTRMQAWIIFRWISATLPDRGEAWTGNEIDRLLARLNGPPGQPVDGAGGQRSAALIGNGSVGGGGSSRRSPEAVALVSDARTLTAGGGRAIHVLASAASDWMAPDAPRAAQDRTDDAASLAAQIAASTRRRSEFRTVAAPRLRRLRRYLLCRVAVRPSKLVLLERATALVDAHYYLGVFAALKEQARRNREARGRRLRETAVAAMRKWRVHAALLAALKQRMSLSDERKKQRLVRRVLLRWHKAADLGRRERIHGRVVERRRKLVVWASWRRAFVTRRAAKASFGRMFVLRFFRKWAELAKEGAKVRRAVQRWHRASLFKAWGRWAQYHDRRSEEMRQAGEQTMAVITNGRKKRAWSAWSTALRQQEVVRRCVQAIRMRSVVGAFRTWKEHAARQAGLRQIEEQVESDVREGALRRRSWAKWREAIARLRAARKAMAFWQRGAVARCFQALKKSVRDTKRAAEKMRPFILRVQNRVAASAFATWVARVHEAQDLREKQKRALAIWTRGTIVRTFRAWAEHARRQKGGKLMADRVLRAWRMQTAARCFRSWAAHAAEAADMHRRMQSVALRLMHSRKGKAVRTWRHWAAERVAGREAMHRAVVRFRSVNVVRAINAWRSWASERSESRRKARQAVARLVMSRQAHAVAHWRKWAASVKQQKLLMGRALHRMRHAGLVRGLQQWREWVGQRVQQRENMRLVLARMRNARAGAGLRAWVGWTQDRQQKRAAMQQVAHRLSKHREVWGLSRWVQYVQRRREAREIMGRSIRRMLFMQGSQALRHWKEWLDERKDVRQRMAVCVSRMKNARVGAALRSWAAWSQARGENRRVLQECVSRIKNHRASTALRTWVGFVRERNEARDLGRRAVRRLQMGSCARAVDTWVDWLRRRQEAKQRMRAVLARMQQGSVVRAIARWRDGTQKRLAEREMLQGVVRRLRGAQQGKALRTWHDWARDRIETRDRVRVVVVRLRRQREASAIRAWYGWAVDRVERRDALRRAVSRFTHATSSRAFYTWRNNAYEQRWERESMRKALSWLTGGAKRKNFSVWKANVRNIRRERALLDHAVRGLQNAKAKAAVTQWREWTAERLRTQDVMAAAATVFRRMGEKRAINQWREWAATRAYNRGVIQRAAARLRNRSLTSAFFGWREAAAQQALGRARMTGAIERLLQSKLRGAFEKWVEARDESREDERKMMFAIKRMQNRGLAGAIDSWREWTAEKVHIREAGQRVLLRWRMSSTVRALNQWSSWTYERIAARDSMRRALAVMRQQGVGRALRQWREWTVDKQRQNAMMRRCAVRMRHSGLVRGLRQWRQWCADRQDSRRRLRAVLLHWRGRRVARALAKLREHAARRQLGRLQVASAMAIWRNAQAGAAFRTWRQNAEEQRHEREVTQKAMRLWELRTAAAAFRAWRENAYSQAENRALLQRAAARFAHALEARAFHRWRVSAAQRVQARRVLRGWIERTKYQAWRQWVAATRQAAQDEVDQRERAARALGFWTQGTTRRVFDRWRGHTDWLASLRERASLVQARAAEWTLRRSMKQWHNGLLAIDFNRRRLANAAMQEWKAAARMGRAEKAQVDSFDRRVERAGRFESVKSAVMRIAKRPLGKAWNSLVLHARQRRFQRLQVVLALTHFQRNVLWRSMRQWHAGVRVQKSERAATTYYEYGLRAKVLDAWSETAAAIRVQKHKMARLAAIALAHRTEKSLESHFRGWASYVGWRKQLRARLSQFLSTQRSASLRSSFEAWAHEARRRAKLRTAVAAFVQHTTKGRLQSAVGFWRAWAARNAWARRAARRFLVGQTTARAFQAWAAFRVQRQRMRELEGAADVIRARIHGRLLRSVFAQWHRAARLERAAAALRSRFMQSNLKPAVFRQWRDGFRTRKFQDSQVAQMMMRRTMTAKRRLFLTWKDAWVEGQRVKAIATSVFQRWRRRNESRAINQWRDWASSRGRTRMVGRAAAVRIANARQVSAVARWREWAAERARLRRAGMIVATRFRRQKEVAALSHWRSWAIGRVEGRAKLRAAGARMRMLGESRALRRWCEWIQERRQAREDLRLVLARMSKSREAAALRTWVEWSRERAAARESMGRAVALMRNAGLARGLRQWRSWTEQTIRNRELLARAAGAFRLTSCKLAINRWRELCSRQQTARDVAARAVRRWTQASMSRCFQGWKNNAREQKEAKVRAAEMFRRRMVRDTRTFFGAWRDTAQDIRLTRIADRTRARLAFGRAMATWKQHVYERQCMRRAVLRMRHIKQARALDEWRRFLTLRRVARLAFGHKQELKKRMFRRLASATMEQRRVRELTRSALQLFKNRSLATSWQRWKAFVRVRRALHSIFDTRMDRLKAETFHRWVANAAQSRRLRIASERVQDALGALGKRRAWDTWRAAYLDRMQQQRNRMRRCFAAIRAFARRRQLQAHRLWLARAQLLRNTALRVLLAWRGHVIDAKKLRLRRIQEQELRMKLRRREMRKRIALMGKVLSQWRGVVIRERHLGGIAKRLQLCLGGPLRRCFDRMKEATIEARQERAGMVRAAQAFRRMGESKAMNRWIVFTRDRRRRRDAMRTVAARVANQHAARAMRQWTAVTRAAALKREELRSSAAAVLELRTGRVFRRWHLAVRRKGAARTALRRWRGGKLAAGFARWRRSYQADRAGDMRRAALRLQCQQRFEAWRENAQYLGKVRRAVEAFSGQRSKHWLGSHLRAWSDVAAAQAFHRGRLVLKSFRGWAGQSAGGNERKKRAMERALVLWNGNTLRRTFQQWSAEVKARRTGKQQAASALVRAFSPMLVRAERAAFKTWISRCRQARAFQRFVEDRPSAQLKRALRWMSRWTRQRQRQKQLVNRARQWLNHRQMSRVFFRWSGLVMAGRRSSSRPASDAGGRGRRRGSIFDLGGGGVFGGAIGGAIGGAAGYLRGDRVSRTIEDKLEEVIESMSRPTSGASSLRGGETGHRITPGEAVIDRDLEDDEAHAEQDLLRRAYSRDPSVVARSVRGSRHGNRSSRGDGSAAVSVAMAFEDEAVRRAGLTLRAPRGWQRRAGGGGSRASAGGGGVMHPGTTGSPGSEYTGIAAGAGSGGLTPTQWPASRAQSPDFDGPEADSRSPEDAIARRAERVLGRRPPVVPPSGGRGAAGRSKGRPAARLPAPSSFGVDAAGRTRRRGSGASSISGGASAGGEGLSHDGMDSGRWGHAAARQRGDVDRRRPSVASRGSSGGGSGLFDDEEDEADALYSARARLEAQERGRADYFEHVASQALSPPSGPRSGARARRAMQRQRELAVLRAEEEQRRHQVAEGRSQEVQRAFRGAVGATGGLEAAEQADRQGRGLSASALATGRGKHGSRRR